MDDHVSGLNDDYCYSTLFVQYATKARENLQYLVNPIEGWEEMVNKEMQNVEFTQPLQHL